jgi:hypothetical protein
MKNNATHMPRWLYALAAIEVVCATYLAIRGQAIQVEVFAATAGGILGFALRDWRAAVDAEIERLRTLSAIWRLSARRTTPCGWSSRCGGGTSPRCSGGCSHRQTGRPVWCSR